ncbi:MAG: hypothetical protein SH819_03765 [Cytophagales bacterium]|nr:hypothetical protein [Cytophagales bacterium]
MKKTMIYLLASVMLIGVLSCSKDDATPSSTLVTAPEAEAGNDTKSGGVYKGALIGSSGIFKVTLQKGKVEIVITLDGVTKTLTTGQLSGWTSGQAIANATFTAGDWSVTFSVDADGGNPYISLTIPGHAGITAVIGKETSTALIKAFEGTYAGTESGTWNIVIQGTVLAGISRGSGGTGGSQVNFFEGTVSGNNISVPDVAAAGVINGDNVSGTWGIAPDNGTWTGKRTL